ncbi:MAG: VWA domain-containing protein [gamma proteobacterium symbiont of Bathyaustriella thionipta]|nr:VWA domain-containing protein [gamma proteobacterium symbiont of Bathyaustriella thionipta]
MGFEFQWPWMALLLLLPPLVYWLWIRHPHTQDEDLNSQRQTLLHPALAHLQESYHARRPRMPVSRRLQLLLPLLLWLLLTLAMMRPQWLEPWEETRSEGYDLMLVVDASHSMEAMDFTRNNQPLTRMAVLKGVMDKFIASRQGDRIGLIVFGSQAYTISPLTYDLDAVRLQLQEVTANIAGQGTAMGDAIGLAVKKLRERPPGSRVLILIADGENTAGSIPPLQAARLAQQEGVRIYAIGVGSDREQVPILEGGRLLNRSDLGLDEQVLRDIATAAKGAYFRATDTSALEEIYAQIDQLEKSHSTSRTVMIPHPLYVWPLALALLILLLQGLFPDARLRTWAKHEHV